MAITATNVIIKENKNSDQNIACKLLSSVIGIMPTGYPRIQYAIYDANAAPPIWLIIFGIKSRAGIMPAITKAAVTHGLN